MNKRKISSNRGKVFILSGPSGSGKTTLHEKLLSSKVFHRQLIKSTSATTRPRRSGERHGRDYIFLTQKQFFYRRRIGYFLEWKKVFDHYYGTPKKKVEAALRQGKSVLLCIDVQGARAVRRQIPDAVTIFIKAPSLSVLKKRLTSRSSEAMKDIQLRLSTARKELKDAHRYDYVIVNQHLLTALKELKAIVAQNLKN